MLRIHSRKSLPITFGGICLLVAMLMPFLPGLDRSQAEFWAILGLFVIGALAFFALAARRTPELEIANDWISVRGTQFELTNISAARVCRVWASGGSSRYLELQFRTMPHLPLRLKLVNIRQLIGFPKACAEGVPFADGPRLLTPINPTQLSDDEINRELSKRLKRA